MFKSSAASYCKRFLLLSAVAELVGGGCRYPEGDLYVKPETVCKIGHETFSRVAVDAVGHRIALRCQSGKGCLLELPACQRVRTPDNLLDSPQHLALSRAGTVLAVAGPQGLQVYNAKEETAISTLHCGHDTYTSVVFSASGDCLYCSTNEPEPTVWRCDLTSNRVSTVFRAQQFELPAAETSEGVLRIYIAPDDTGMAIVFRRAIVVCDVSSQTTRYILNNESGSTLAMFSADSTKFILAQLNTLVIRGARNGELLGTCNARATAISVTRDPNTILSAGDGIELAPNFINVISLEKMQVVHRVHAHNNAVLGLVCSPENTVVSACVDGTISTWRFEDILQ